MSPRDRAFPFRVALIVAALTAGAWILFWPRSDAVAPPQERVELRPAPAEGGDDGDASKAGPVRILVKAVGTNPGDANPGAVLAEIEHQGPLQGRDRESLLAALRQRLDNRQRQIENSNTNAQDSAALLHEAELILEAATTKAAIRALETGSYVTTLPGAKSPPLTLPESEVIGVGAMLEGKPVHVTLVMPWRDHSEMAQARQYYDAVLAFDNSERARRFNALPDAERLPLAARILRILRNPEASQAELHFVRNLIGFGSRLSEPQGLVIVPAR